jgi:MFS family permease
LSDLQISSINGGIIANVGFVHQFATETNAEGQPALASPILSGWGSIMSVGQVTGMTSLSFLSGKFGRKAAMWCIWVMLVGSIITECLAWAWPHWLVAKLLAGIGIGGIQTIIPTYLSEVAPVRIRGGILMLYTFWWSLGGLFGSVALQDLNARDSHNYLMPIYTQWAHIGLIFIFFFIVPESPAWCVSVGKIGQAKAELKRLNGNVKGYDIERQAEILVLIAEHERTIAIEQSRESWYSIFRGVDGMRTLISLWTILTQQFIGLTLFATFAAYFFQQAGLQNPFMITVITSSINIATVMIVVLIADSVGRRILACGGTTVCWLACIAIGVIGVVPQSSASNYVFVLFACVWSMFSPPLRPDFSNHSIFVRVLLTGFGSRCWLGYQWCHRLGLRRRNFITAFETLYGWLFGGYELRYRYTYECPRSIHGQRKSVELGPENWLVLCRLRTSIRHWNVVLDS